MSFNIWFANEFIKHWDNRLLGELLEYDIEVLQNGDANEPDIINFPDPIKILLANIAAALSTNGLLGTAQSNNLKSVKSRIDTSASHVFFDMLKFFGLEKSISTSEAKDEHGASVDDPLTHISDLHNNNYRIAVDVVDGTTLAAKGLNGSYSISAGAYGLLPFPDLQAYAIGAPYEILNKINFNNTPEKEIESIIINLCNYYNKKPSELKIVTHSFDTGNHHTKLIEIIKNHGVQVIIPDPVIVEPPFVIGMALRTRNSPDCMIGVFGLPEIVINTLLLTTLKKDFGLNFKIASNHMLNKSEQKQLSDAFNFSPQEIEQINELNLRIDEVYSEKSIIADQYNACFSASALTDDPILGLQGCHKVGPIINLETIFSGYNGYIIKIKTQHKCINSINYAACYPQPICDLSIVLPIKDEFLVNLLNQFINKLKNSSLRDSLSYTPVSDFHVTLFELGVHYGKYSFLDNLKAAKIESIAILKNISSPIPFDLIEPKISNNSIIFLARISPGASKNIEDKLFFDRNNSFYNVKQFPECLHITIARFHEYLSQEKMDILESIINQFKNNEIHNSISYPTLVQISTTPYSKQEVL